MVPQPRQLVPASARVAVGAVMEQGIVAGMFLRSFGEGRGSAPLLFLHGLGETGLCFDGVLDQVALAGRRALVPDLPGYGRSAWASPPLSLSGTAAHLAGWLRRRDPLEPVVLIGHSMGGVVALLLAEAAPELVAAVVDVDGNKAEADCAFSGRAARQPLEAFLAEGLGRLRDEIYRGGLEDEALRGYHVGLRLADPQAYHLHSLELVELSRAEDLARRLAALSAPTVYFAGSPGGASPRSLALLGQAGVGVRTIGPSGHWPFIDQPARFVAELAAFLERLP